MIEVAHKTYLRIMSIVPPDCKIFERTSANADRSFKFNRSPEWVSLYYLKKERGPNLKEGYWLRFEKNEFKAELFQGWKENKTHWGSVEDHPELNESFQGILDWAVEQAQLQAEEFQATQLENKKKLEKSLASLERKIKKIDFTPFHTFLDIILQNAKVKDFTAAEKLTSRLTETSSYLNPETNDYQLDQVLRTVLENLVSNDFAVWVDWKDTESWEAHTKAVLAKCSLPVSDFKWDADESSIEKRIKKLSELLIQQKFGLFEIDTNSDEYLFFFAKLEQKSTLELVWSQLHNLKLKPKKWKLK